MIATPVAEPKTDSEKSTMQLPPFVVTAKLFKPPLSPLELSRYRMFLDLDFKLGGWPMLSGDFVLTPERAPQLRRNSVFSVWTIDATSDPALPAGIWLDMPELAGRLEPDSFGSLSAVRDQKTKPVLLDGVRANDPFDGTIDWSELPDAALSRVEGVPLGGATAWGDAPAGVVQLFTAPAIGRTVVEPPRPGADPNVTRRIVRETGLLTADVGEFGTYEVELVHTEPTRAGMLQLLAQANTTDGFVAVLPKWRSGVDKAEWARDRRLETRWRRPLGKNYEFTATVGKAEDSHGLGTAYQNKHSRAQFASLAFAGQSASGLMWNGTVYVRNQASDRTFSAVDRSRETETPLFDEFAEPVVSWGASWTGMWRHNADDARTNFGFDIRTAHGETRSELGSSNGAFTVERSAGANEGTMGGFAIHNRQLTESLRGMLGVRFDWRRETGGHARETSLISGQVAQDVRESDVGEGEFSPSAGVIWEPRAGWRLRLWVQESFQPPTLADQYRVSGVNNRLIEPNANLRTERSTSAEVSIEYAPTSAATLSARAFVNRLRDAIGTRVVSPGSGESLVFATLPETVEHRRRINLDEVRVEGVEFLASGRPVKTLSIEAEIRLEHAEIWDVAQAPLLAGNAMPGSPHCVAAGRVNWQVSPSFSLYATVCWLGREFVDEENSQGLGEAVVLNCGVDYAFASQAGLFLRIENIGDARVEIARGGDGVAYGGTPRAIGGGMRISW